VLFRSVLASLAGELLSRPLARDTALILACAVDALPTRSVPFQLGAMRSRPGDALRLVTRNIAGSRVVGYLRAIGWAGDDRMVTRIIRALVPAVDSLALSLDLMDAVQPRIGIECYVKPGSRFRSDWRRLAERLVELDLCTSDQAAALLGWSGVCRPETCAAPWPRHLLWGDRLLASRAASVIARTLGHVKIVLQPGSPPHAKAYLGFAHYWIEARKSDRSWGAAPA